MEAAFFNNGTEGFDSTDNLDVLTVQLELRKIELEHRKLEIEHAKTELARERLKAHLSKLNISHHLPFLRAGLQNSAPCRRLIMKLLFNPNLTLIPCHKLLVSPRFCRYLSRLRTRFVL